MLNKYIAIFVFFLATVCFGADLKLDPNEKEFLQKHQNIVCASTNTWAPFNTNTEKSHLAGISVDFWTAITKKAGIKPGDCQIYPAFSKVLEDIKAKKADLTISTSITKERLEYAEFSKPYASFPIVIATRDEVEFISETSQLAGKKVAVGEGFTSTKYLQDAYEDIEYVEVKNMDEALLLLSSEMVYAAVDVLPVLVHHIEKRGYKNLKISGKTEFTFDIRFMVRDDYPLLVDVINKGIDSLSQEQKDVIFKRWFLVNYENEANIELMIELGVVIFLIVAFWLYREYALKKHHQELNRLLEELEEKNQLLKELSITDKLTGLFNRVKIDEVLKANLGMFERYDNVFSVVVLDIDNFKKINDNFGHPVGDDVLQEFAKILQQNIRATDTIGRWGGEEFMIICSETDSAGAVKLAGLLREKIASCEFEKVGHVTASFGVSQVDVGDSIEELVNRADWALYSAKDEGKNRVVCSL